MFILDDQATMTIPFGVPYATLTRHVSSLQTTLHWLFSAVSANTLIIPKRYFESLIWATEGERSALFSVLDEARRKNK
jgi:hypothetical protein